MRSTAERLEQSTVTRLGSSVVVPVAFRLVAATNKDLRVLVAEGDFRADFYYRLAVIKLRIPKLQERGLTEKRVLFQVLLRQHGIQDEASEWLLQRIEGLRFPGNVRELSNLAERVAVVRRQLQGWDSARLERILDGMGQAQRVVAAAQCAPVCQPLRCRRPSASVFWPRCKATIQRIRLQAEYNIGRAVIG